MVRFATAGSRGSWLAALFVWIVMAIGCATNTPSDPLEDGVTAYREGRTSDAELIWLEALNKSESVGKEDPRLAQSLFVLSNLAIHQQRFEEAKSLLERWLEIHELRHEIGDETFADGVEALAGIYMVQGNFVRASELYERALEIRENDTSEDNIALAESLEELANAYEAQGRRDEATPLYERAIQIREEVLGAYDVTLADSLHNFAVVNHDRGHLSVLARSSICAHSTSSTSRREPKGCGPRRS